MSTKVYLVYDLQSLIYITRNYEFNFLTIELETQEETKKLEIHNWTVFKDGRSLQIILKNNDVIFIPARMDRKSKNSYFKFNNKEYEMGDGFFNREDEKYEIKNGIVSKFYPTKSIFERIKSIIFNKIDTINKFIY